MKRMFLLLTTAFWLALACTEAQAQQKVASSSWESLLEQWMMVEGEESDTEWENLMEELTALHEHPICINTATRQQLELLFFLSPRQIEDILFHIDADGPIHMPGGLMLVPSLDYYTRQLLACFLNFDVPEKPEEMGGFSQWMTKGRSAVIGRMDIPFYTRSGNQPFTRSDWEDHPSHHYWGNPLYSSLRYSYQYREHLYWGVAAEKDAGEPFFTPGIDGDLLGRTGFDYYSGYVQLKDRGFLRNLTLGTYRLSFGQGLVMNTNFYNPQNEMFLKK